MSASSRFGYSMFTGAVVSAGAVAWESTKRKAQLASASAGHHVSAGPMRLEAFALGAVIIGLVLFVLASLVVLKASNRGSSRQPAQGRQRSYGGSR